ncbi:MAG: TIGR01212 family radical SAM protein [Bacteroidaceae bacterium]|nr:TIGR01212 family radical SAM protein [Bacteroidaceae bacterium]
MYRTMNEYLAGIFPGRVIKVAVNAGLGCPNLGRCIYCNNLAFNPGYAAQDNSGSITAQLEKGIKFNSRKGDCYGYLAYFQSYTNTFGPTDKLIQLYEEALQYPDVKGLVIATRPDCIKPDLADWFEQRFGLGAPKDHPHLLIEIGIESTNDRMLELINRHHTYQCAVDCINDLNKRGIDTGAHLILGLPGETEQDFMTHAHRVSALPIKTLKLHQLQVVKGTKLAQMYQADPSQIKLFTAQEYAEIVARFINTARKDIFYDRFVSETPSSMLIAPAWGLKPQVWSQMLDKIIRNTYICHKDNTYYSL